MAVYVRPLAERLKRTEYRRENRNEHVRLPQKGPERAPYGRQGAISASLPETSDAGPAAYMLYVHTRATNSKKTLDGFLIGSGGESSRTIPGRLPGACARQTHFIFRNFL